MSTFATVYTKANKTEFKDADHAHTLAMLVLTLNTATHNPNEERKISLEDWCYYCDELTESGMSSRVCSCHHFCFAIQTTRMLLEPICTKEYLSQIWEDIQRQEIRMPMEVLLLGTTPI
jgi:hypothetical protein